jgi:hypothetical protein
MLVHTCARPKAAAKNQHKTCQRPPRIFQRKIYLGLGLSEVIVDIGLQEIHTCANLWNYSAFVKSSEPETSSAITGVDQCF